VLIAPAGFIEPGKESVRLMKRVQEFSSTQPNVKVDAVSLANEVITIGKFVDSLASFPIENFDINHVLDDIYPPATKLPESANHVQVIDFSPKSGYRQPELPREVELLKKRIDEFLVNIFFSKEVLETATPTEIRAALVQMLQKRNDLLTPYVIKAYDGTPAVTPAQTEFQKKVTFFANAMVSVPTLVDMLSGKTLKIVKSLQDKTKISFIVPDRDLLVPLTDYQEMGYIDNVKALMRGYTHASWVTGGSQGVGGDMEQALRAALN
jgi:hypothetical protein